MNDALYEKEKELLRILLECDLIQAITTYAQSCD